MEKQCYNYFKHYLLVGFNRLQLLAGALTQLGEGTEAQYYLDKYYESGMLSELGKEFIDESIQRDRRDRNKKNLVVFLFVSSVSILGIFSIFKEQETRKINIKLQK